MRFECGTKVTISRYEHCPGHDTSIRCFGGGVTHLPRPSHVEMKMCDLFVQMMFLKVDQRSLLFSQDALSL
jgi:hypothetical protein